MALETPTFVKALALATSVASVGACRTDPDLSMLLNQEADGTFTATDLKGGGEFAGVSGKTLEEIGLPVEEAMKHYGPTLSLIVDESMNGNTPILDIDGLPIEISELSKELEGENTDTHYNDNEEEEPAAQGLDEEAIAPQLFQDEIRTGEDVWCFLENKVFIEVPFNAGVYENGNLDEVSLDPNCCPRISAFGVLLEENRDILEALDTTQMGSNELALWASLTSELNSYITYTDFLKETCDQIADES